MKDLNFVYQAISKEAAELELDRLEEKWGDKYPIVINSWRNKFLEKKSALYMFREGN
jgi:transposase-like protein